MLAVNSQGKMSKTNLSAIGQVMCPDCKTVMAEVDRLAENGVSFIWYECTRDGCDGQWLDKRTSKTGSN